MDKKITNKKRKELLIKLLNCMRLPCINNPANLKAKLLTHTLVNETFHIISSSILFLENREQNLEIDGNGLEYITNVINDIELEQEEYLKKIEESCK